MSTDPFKTAKPGDRVELWDGFTPIYGKVYGRIKGKWGETLRIKCDDYTFEHIESFTEQSDNPAAHPIGVYYLGKK